MLVFSGHSGSKSERESFAENCYKDWNSDVPMISSLAIPRLEIQSYVIDPWTKKPLDFDTASIPSAKLKAKMEVQLQDAQVCRSPRQTTRQGPSAQLLLFPLMDSETLTEYLAAQNNLIEEASEAIPHQFSQCTYPLGHIR